VYPDIVSVDVILYARTAGVVVLHR